MADKNINNAGWFIAGIGLGAVAAILFAPKSGQALRSDILTGPGGSEIVLDDPSGNPVELFQPASR